MSKSVRFFIPASCLIYAVMTFGYSSISPRGYADDPAGPNIVLMLADDLRRGDLTVYGAEGVRTPNLQRLADSGMTFDRAFVASPSCAPSRGALLTGLMPARNGAEANHTYPRDDVAMLTSKLRAAGYEIAAFGKIAHNVMDERYDVDFYSKPRVGLAKNVRKYLITRKSDKPLCLMIGDRRPHVPWRPEMIYDPEKVRLPEFLIDTKETREHWARYLSDVTGLDAEVGEIMAIAKEQFGDNYIFVHSSDHGAQWPFGKWNLYENGINVPLIVSWPGNIAPGSRTDAMISWVDILPTLIDVAGGELPQGLDGKPFTDVLLGKTDSFRDEIYATHSGDGNMNVYPIRSVRTGRFKFILNLRPDCYHSNHSDILRKDGAGAYWDSWDEAAKTDPAAAAIIAKYYARPAEEFYDLEKDPTEQHNLIDNPEYKTQVDEMRSRLSKWMKEQGDTRSVFNTPYPLSGPTPHEFQEESQK